MTQMTIFVAVAVLSNTVHSKLLALNICLYNEIIKLQNLGTEQCRGMITMNDK